MLLWKLFKGGNSSRGETISGITVNNKNNSMSSWSFCFESNHMKYSPTKFKLFKSRRPTFIIQKE